MGSPVGPVLCDLFALPYDLRVLEITKLLWATANPSSLLLFSSKYTDDKLRIVRIVGGSIEDLERNIKETGAFIRATILSKGLYPGCKLITDNLATSHEISGLLLASSERSLIESKATSRLRGAYQCGYGYTPRNEKTAKVFAQLYRAAMVMTQETRKRKQWGGIAETLDDFRRAAHTEKVLRQAVQKLQKRLAPGLWKERVTF